MGCSYTYLVSGLILEGAEHYINCFFGPKSVLRHWKNINPRLLLLQSLKMVGPCLLLGEIRL
ncbi:hypothetical protein ACS0TY_029874 [Phlomoides rotata]